MASNDQPVANENTQVVWYCLVDSNGNKKTRATRIRMVPGEIIDGFLERIMVNHPVTLENVEAALLTVYKNKALFDAALEDKKKPDSNDKVEGPLKSSFQLTGLGEEKKNALLVVVPDLHLGREAKHQKLEPELPKGDIVPISDWFLFELLPLGSALELDTEAWMTMTYNGKVSNVILEHPMEDQMRVECSSTLR